MNGITQLVMLAEKEQQIKAAIVFWRFDVQEQNRWEDRLFDVQDHAENVLNRQIVNTFLRALDMLKQNEV